MYTHEISAMYCMEIPVCVTYECYMQDLIPGWTVVRLQNLQCFSSGDAAVFHQAIDVHVKVFLATIG